LCDEDGGTRPETASTSHFRDRPAGVEATGRYSNRQIPQIASTLIDFALGEPFQNDGRRRT